MRKKILIPEIIIVLVLIIALVYLLKEIFNKNQAYSVLKNSLEAEITVLEDRYKKDSIYYLKVKKTNDSLLYELKRVKNKITRIQANYNQIEIAHRIIIDSLENLHDTLLSQTIAQQVEYEPDSNDTQLLIPTPVARKVVTKLAEWKMFKFQVDTLLTLNLKYEEYTNGLESLIEGKEKEIKITQDLLTLKINENNKLRLLNKAQEQEIKKMNRTKNLVLIGGSTVVVGLTTLLLIGAL